MIAILIVGVMLFCIRLYRLAVYAVPAYLGFASAFWAFGHGVGAGSVAIGIGVAFGAFTFARHIAENGHSIFRTLVIAIFALPAAYAGFEIVEQLGVYLVPSTYWRIAFALFAGLAVGVTSAAKLAPRRIVGSADS